MRFFIATHESDTDDIQVPLSVRAVNHNELYVIVSEVTSDEESYTSEGWWKFSDQMLACNMLIRLSGSVMVGLKLFH